MFEIDFPKNLPDEFRADFASAFNEIIYLREKLDSVQRKLFAQRTERFIKQDFIEPKNSLFNEPEQILAEYIEEPVNYFHNFSPV